MVHSTISRCSNPLGVHRAGFRAVPVWPHSGLFSSQEILAFLAQAWTRVHLLPNVALAVLLHATSCLRFPEHAPAARLVSPACRELILGGEGRMPLPLMPMVDGGLRYSKSSRQRNLFTNSPSSHPRSGCEESKKQAPGRVIGKFQSSGPWLWSFTSVASLASVLMCISNSLFRSVVHQAGTCLMPSTVYLGKSCPPSPYTHTQAGPVQQCCG